MKRFDDLLVKEYPSIFLIETKGKDVSSYEENS